jgi:hypothetical protein
MGTNDNVEGGLSRGPGGSGADSRHCSVCGEAVGSKRTVRAPDGRLVCETCVEEARQVLVARKARAARAEAELRKQKELERVEGDNRLVLELQADEWLSAAANSCPSCGRFIALADSMCHACGDGAPTGPARKALSFGKRASRGNTVALSRLQHAGGPVEDLLETIDPRLVRGVPAALAGLAVVGLVLSLAMPWTWSAATIGMIVLGASVFAGSMIVLFQQSARDAVPVAVTGLVAGAATIIAGRSARLEVDVACVFGAAVMCGAACWAGKRARMDETLTWAWGGLAAACVVAAGVLASRL